MSNGSLLNFHDAMTRIYELAATAHLDQFRTLALALTSEAVQAQGAFWGFGKADRDGGDAIGVIRYGETAGRVSALEKLGPSNPNWPSHAPEFPAQLPVDGIAHGVRPSTHFQVLQFCYPLRSGMGYQIVNYYGARTSNGPADEITDFRNLALHLCRAMEVAAKVAMRAFASNGASALCDQSGQILFCSPGFIEVAESTFRRDCSNGVPSVNEINRKIGGFAEGTHVTAAPFGSLHLIAIDANEALRALSQREYEVAREVATGLADKQIALKLGISASTVSNHVNSILKKVGIESRQKLRDLVG